MTPFISICIPAYKNADYLQRLLVSILIQTYTDFEVVITDDSPDDSVFELLASCKSAFEAANIPLRYYKNTPALGTPANWNEAISKANGHWIKLMHDDDWLAHKTSLQSFTHAINQNPRSNFFFSAFVNVKLDSARSNQTDAHLSDFAVPDAFDLANNQNSSESNPAVWERETIKPGSFRLKQLHRNPVTLLAKNIIGPPSAVLHRNERNQFYDVNMQWLVDIDFYIRILEGQHAVYIDEPLVNIGLNFLQVTRTSALVREIEIPEHFLVLQKTGVKHLRNILVYDAWWRLLRNLRIKELNEIRGAGYTGQVPVVILNILAFQKRFSYSLLKLGVFSKSLMVCSYGYNKVSDSFNKKLR